MKQCITTLIIALPLLALASFPAAYSQTAPVRSTANGSSQITVDGTTYNVKPLGGMLRIDNPDGSMLGMTGKDGSVLAPQSGPGFQTVKAVIDAYLHPANGTAPHPDEHASATNVVPSVPGPMEATLQSRERAVKFTPNGAIVYDPDLKANVTVQNDGTEVTVVREMQTPTGILKSTLVARYEGGAEPDSGAKKVLKVLKGGATATLESKNSSRVNTIRADSDTWAEYKLDEKGKQILIYEPGGVRTGDMALQGHDAFKTMGEATLRAMKKDVEAVNAAAAAKQAAHETVPYDISSPKSQRAVAALDHIQD